MLLTGQRIGWYPYPFLDTSALGYPRVFVNIVALTIGFAVMGLAVVWIDRTLARETRTTP